MDYVTLNTGDKMPIIGTGTNTYGKEDNEYSGELNGDFSALKSAIDLGYRSIDAAISYNNEAGVGETVANSGVPREEFFLTSKIPNGNEYVQTREVVRNTIENSLKNFDTEYLDLFLIHHPIENKEYFKQTWQVLEEMYEEGKLKNIGVSNFDKGLLDELEEFGTIKPAVNQIQVNLKNPNSEMIKLLQQRDITPVAWGPMEATDEQKESLDKIGEKYAKSWAQVLLRYQTQRGIAVIPKSHDQENQKANLEILNFEMTKEDMMKIDNI